MTKTFIERVSCDLCGNVTPTGPVRDVEVRLRDPAGHMFFSAQVDICADCSVGTVADLVKVAEKLYRDRQEARARG